MRASITYTRYTIHELSRARAHARTLRIATGAMYIRERAEDYKYEESAMWESSIFTARFLLFPRSFFSRPLFFPFVFVLSSLNARMPFLARAKEKGGDGDRREKGGRGGGRHEGVFN